jgi:hypothetical protein
MIRPRISRWKGLRNWLTALTRDNVTKKTEKKGIQIALNVMDRIEDLIPEVNPIEWDNLAAVTRSLGLELNFSHRMLLEDMLASKKKNLLIINMQGSFLIDLENRTLIFKWGRPMSGLAMEHIVFDDFPTE